MQKKRGNAQMLIPTIVMAVLAVTLLLIGYYRGTGEHIAGTRTGLVMIVQILPLLLCAFIIAGMVQVLLPQELIGRWVGAESGLRGLLIGSAAGGSRTAGGFSWRGNCWAPPTTRRRRLLVGWRELMRPVGPAAGSLR